MQGDAVIRSMTGYGQARWNDGARVVQVEVRTVNGKHFKMHPRIPHEFASMEHEIEKTVRKVVARGSVDLYVRVQFEGARAARPVNREALLSYVRELQEVAAETGATVTLTSESLSALPGVLEAEELTSKEAEELEPRIRETLDGALAELNDMRETEGRSLRDALLAHCARRREHSRGG